MCALSCWCCIGGFERCCPARSCTCLVLLCWVVGNAGGVEDYCQAAAAALAPAGRFVVCCGLQGQPFKGQRAQRAAAAANLVITRQVTVVTKEGKPPLFAVYVMQAAADVLSSAGHLQEIQQLLWQQGKQAQEQPHTQGNNGHALEAPVSVNAQVLSGQLWGSEEVFVVRSADGSHTAAWHEAREALGLPPLAESYCS